MLAGKQRQEKDPRCDAASAAIPTTYSTGSSIRGSANCTVWDSVDCEFPDAENFSFVMGCFRTQAASMRSQDLKLSPSLALSLDCGNWSGCSVARSWVGHRCGQDLVNVHTAPHSSSCGMPSPALGIAIVPQCVEGHRPCVLADCRLTFDGSSFDDSRQSRSAVVTVPTCLACVRNFLILWWAVLDSNQRPTD